MRTRPPGVDVRLAPAEELPFEDAAFDAALAQLVVHFMADSVAGIREMVRVTRSGGRGRGVRVGPRGRPRAAVDVLERGARARPRRTRRVGAGRRARGAPRGAAREAGLSDVAESELRVEVPFESVDDWWTPYTLGVGPAGVYVAALDEPHREALRGRCAELLPAAPFTIPAVAWCVRGRV